MQSFSSFGLPSKSTSFIRSLSPKISFIPAEIDGVDGPTKIKSGHFRSFASSNSNANASICSLNNESLREKDLQVQNLITTDKKNKPARTKYFITCPLWLIFLFQIIIIIVIFCTVATIISINEHKISVRAMDNHIGNVIDNVRNSILVPIQWIVRSGITLRTNMIQNAKRLRCRDDDSSVEGNWELLLYLYNLIDTSDLLKYVFIDQVSSYINPANNKHYVTECGAGHLTLWKVINDYQNASSYVPSSMPYDMYYDKKEYKISLFNNSYYSNFIEDQSYLNFAFETNDIDIFEELYIDISSHFVLSLTIVFSITKNSKLAAKYNKSASILIEVDATKVSNRLKKYTPDVEGAHTTLYDITRLPFVVIAAGSILPYNITSNKTAELWIAGHTPSESVNVGFEQAYILCHKRCRTITKVIDDKVITAKTLIFQKKNVFLLVQSVSKSYYFGEMIAASKQIYILCSVAVILIIIICSFIMLAIRQTIVKLKKNMDLAAMMQNDKVEPTLSYLSELQNLSESFNVMNVKLLVARAFMPEAYLVEEMNDEEGETDEGENSDNPSTKGISRNKSFSSKNSGSSYFQSCSSGSKFSDSNILLTKITNSTSTNSQEKVVLQRMALSTKRVTVLALNVRGFLKNNPEVTNIMQSTEKFLTIVQSSVTTNNGVVDSYHGDHIVVAFNASRSVSSCGTSAVICALQIRDRLEDTNVGKLSMGAATSSAVVGSMGNDKTRRFSVIGHQYGRAIKLEQASNRLEKREGHSYGPFGCLINTDIASEIETTMDYQLVGQIHQYDGNHILAYAINKLPIEQELDEWMYQLANINKPFLYYNKAFMLLLKGNLEMCKQEIENQRFSNLDAQFTDSIENNKDDYVKENSKQDYIKTSVVIPHWERLSSLLNNISEILSCENKVYNNDIILNNKEFQLPTNLPLDNVTCWL